MKDHLKMEDQPVILIEKRKSEVIFKAATLWVSVLVMCLGVITGTALAQDQGRTLGNTAKRATYLSARATDLKPAAPASAEPKTEPAAASSKTDTADLVEQLDELRSAMDSQAAQIEAQRELLMEQQQKM